MSNPRRNDKWKRLKLVVFAGHQRRKHSARNSWRCFVQYNIRDGSVNGKHVWSWSFPCDISHEQFKRETAETGWFYAETAMDEMIEQRLKLAVPVWHGRRRSWVTNSLSCLFLWKSTMEYFIEINQSAMNGLSEKQLSLICAVKSAMAEFMKKELKL